MNIWLLVKREIAHKKIGFLTGVFSLIIATAGFIAGTTLLGNHDAATEKIRIEMERELRSEMTEQEDYYRRIMRDMGYNVLIIHKEQDLSELRRLGHPTTYFDYEDVWKLAHGEVETLNHLLPVLQERIRWREQDMEIMLSGIRGQVPVFTKPQFLTDDDQYRSPITERVPDGKADLGYTVAITLELRPGDTITIQGQSFQVNRIFNQRGTTDDITVWIPLEKAQTILGKTGKINGIFALECVCDLDELGGITEEVTAILPHTQVFEFTSLIAARAGVRHRAEQAHREVIESVMAHREASRREMERLASIIVPLLVFGAGIWIFLLIYNNMRERRAEIGIYRAVGYLRVTILKIFLAKSLIMGLVGGVLGCLLGLGFGIYWSDLESAGGLMFPLVSPSLLLAGLLLAPVLSFTAGFLPAVLASNQQPAVILREE